MVFLFFLGLGVLALVGWAIYAAFFGFIDASLAWTATTWWIIGIATYIALATLIFGIAGGTIGDAARAFFISALTIAVPGALYFLVLWLISWKTGVWVSLAGVCGLIGVSWWLIVALQDEK